MPGQFRPDGEEAFDQTIGEVLGIILNFITVITTFQHHNGSPGDNHSKDQFYVRSKAEESGTNGNEDPLKTMAPMIPSTAHGDDNGQALRTMRR